MKRAHLAPGFALFALLFASACETGQTVTAEDTVTQTFQAVANPRVVVETFNGRIEASAGTGSDVSVTVTKVGEGSSAKGAERDLESISVAIGREGNVIGVQAAGNGSATAGHSAAHVSITVPAGASLDLKTANGEVTVTGVGGGVKVESANGSVRVAAARGQVNVRSKDGSIEIEGQAVAVDARTENGEVTFTGSLTDSVHQLRSANGAITADLPPDAEFRLEASTINGTVECAFKLQGADTSARTNLDGATSPAARATLAIHTNNGNITVR